jgi:hypothetical protein
MSISRARGDVSSIVLFLLIGSIVLPTVCTGLNGCNRAKSAESLDDGDSSGETKRDPKAVAAKIDKDTSEAIEKGHAAEARQWCSPEEKTHGGWKMSKADMLKMANEIYAAGAVKVWVMNPSELNPQAIIAAEMAAEIPADAAKRKPLFDYCNKWLKDTEQEETLSDVGQKYMDFNLDL